MKTNFCRFLFGFVMITHLPLLHAGTSDVEIHVAPRRVDATTPTNEADNTRTVSKEHWNYEVTVENKTFKPLDRIDVKYVRVKDKVLPAEKPFVRRLAKKISSSSQSKNSGVKTLLTFPNF